jgi:hypothetical protein
VEVKDHGYSLRVAGLQWSLSAWERRMASGGDLHSPDSAADSIAGSTDSADFNFALASELREDMAGTAIRDWEAKRGWIMDAGE